MNDGFEENFDFGILLEKCESGGIHGGTIEIAPDDSGLGDVILAHILKQKEKNKENGIQMEKTLMVAPPLWLKTLLDLVRQKFQKLDFHVFDKTWKELVCCDVVFVKHGELAQFKKLLKRLKQKRIEKWLERKKKEMQWKRKIKVHRWKQTNRKNRGNEKKGKTVETKKKKTPWKRKIKVHRWKQTNRKNRGNEKKGKTVETKKKKTPWKRKIKVHRWKQTNRKNRGNEKKGKTVETKKKKTPWKRIILHNILEGSEKRFPTVCKFSAEYCWCLTENFKQDYLAHFLKLGRYGEKDYWNRFRHPNLDDPEQEKKYCSNDIYELLLQAILRFPSNETQNSTRFFDDANQKNFMEKLKECEKQNIDKGKQDSHGGTVTITFSKFREAEVMFAHILEQKKFNEIRENTLVVGPPMWIYDCEDLVNKHFQNVLSTHFCYGQKSTENFNVASHDIVFATYNELNTVSELQNIKWTRIVLRDTCFVKNYNSDEFKTLRKLKSDYRWCLTNNPKQHYLAHFLKLGSFGDEDYWHQFVNASKRKKSLLKDVERLLEQANLRFPSYDDDHIQLINSAKEEKDSSQFSRMVWEAMFIFTKFFVLKRFDFRIESNAQLEKVYEILCEGFYGKHAVDVMECRSVVHWNYVTCDQDNFFLPHETKEKLIERVEKSFELIEIARTDLIRGKIEDMKAEPPQQSSSMFFRTFQRVRQSLRNVLAF